MLIVVVVALAWYCWHDFRRYARQSRLEQPDKFKFVATVPESLVGRVDDLERLLRVVTQNRIVLLDGESGCGKSALVAAGLVPRLQGADGLLPILVRDWGDDWIRGPLAAMLEALYGALTPERRGRIKWARAPDLAASAKALATDLSERLDAVSKTLHRRLLLIADQFDDYQTRHREHCLDADGNWLAPAELTETNLFWRLVCSRLLHGELHLLAVTRADTASGLACLRFLDDQMIATRTLPRAHSSPHFPWDMKDSVGPRAIPERIA